MKLMKTGSPWVVVFAAATVLLMITGGYQTASALTCYESGLDSELFWKPADTELHSGVGYPETKSAHYWGYTFDNSPGLRLKLTARFPRVRYMAYTLYNVDPGDYQGSVIGTSDGEPQHLSDQEIEPASGGNPFLNGVDRHAVDGTYEINIIRDDSSRKDDPGLKNKLIIPSNIKKVSVFLRVYVPDNPDLDDPLALQGGVDLPKIEAFNDDGGTETCQYGIRMETIVSQDSIVKPDRLDTALDQILLPDNKIETFRPGPAGLFPNGDAPYLVAPLVMPTATRPMIAVLRFKAPTFPDTRAGDDFMDSDEQQVRYWSVCIGGWVTTQSGECLSDQEVPVDEEGYVHLLIGPDDLISGDPNWINLKWTWPDTGERILNPILLFRQISTRPEFTKSFDAVDYAFNANGVEDVDVSLVALYNAGKQASLDIEEYAPAGVYCTQDQFKIDKCGIDNPSGATTGGCGN